MTIAVGDLRESGLDGPPVVPGYEILGELGRGGMGVVYKARQLRLNRIVALKMILAGDHAAPEAAVRFLAEAEAVARLHHPHIVQIFEFGEHDGRPYFAMEYVAGGSLADRLDGHARGRPGRGPAGRDARPGHPRGAPAGDRPPRPEAGQHPAHGRRHRPRSPTSAWPSGWTSRPGLTRTPVDRRLAQLHGPGAGRRQGRGAIGPAADVYSLGAILYELLTGRPPFQAATVLETLEQVRSAEPVVAAPTAAETAARPGDDLPEVPGEGAGQALRLGADSWPRTCGGSEPASRSRRGPSGTPERALAVVPPRAGARDPGPGPVAGLVGVATQWWRAESHLKDAIYQRGLAENNLGRELDANRKLQVAKDQEAKAHRLAKQRFDEAVKAIGHFGQMTNDAALMRDPKLEDLRGRLLKTALGFYRDIQASLEEDASPETRSQLSEAYDRIAYISWELGLNDEALATYRRALAWSSVWPPTLRRARPPGRSGQVPYENRLHAPHAK